MLRHWLRFVQPLALSFVVFSAAAMVVGQETPTAPNPPADPAAAVTPETPPPAEAAKPAAEAAPAEAKPETAPAEAPPSEAKPADAKPPEEPAKEEPAKTEATEAPKAEPAEAPKPAEAAEPKPAAAPDAAAPAAVFAAKLAEWKEVLKELQKLRADYKTATPDQLGGIELKWTETTTKAEAMIESLREAGKAAYAAAPNSDEALTEFLIKILADDVARDNYEPAADLSKVLVDNGCDKKELYDPAGIAAFATNDFDAAEKRAKRAQDDGKLSENGKKNLEEVPSYKKYWQEEQEIRKKEAEQNDLPRVRLSTSKGDMMIELFENEAPETVGNFISLVEQKFYDGLVFHRVLPAFMAQGGCPRGDGTGDPGYKIYCECYKENYRKHFRGTLSMAHAGKDTGGSQFFITFLPTPHLNGKHTAFGRVVEGMDVLAKLQRIDPQASGSKPEPDKIIQAEVIRKREHAYEAHKVQ
ncbi:MAG: peptidylprolyl isomerase [Pirellulaceae bacterium]|nr:peptidylprolyl isomerase [Pirellulaceae bacterium]